MNAFSCLSALFVLLLLLLSYGPVQAAANSSPPIFGIITLSGCAEIRGEVISQTTDVNGNQKIDICKFGDKNYRVVENTSCLVDQTGIGKDPVSGKVYTFGYICDVPQTCDLPTWGLGLGDHFSTKLHIITNGKALDIVTSFRSISCISETFDLAQKKVSISVQRGDGNSAGSVDVTIPNELLSGNFTAQMDGNRTDFSISTVGNTSKITVPVEFDNNAHRNIEITGTNVIPEFPSASVAAIAGISSALFALRSYRARANMKSAAGDQIYNKY